MNETNDQEKYVMIGTKVSPKFAETFNRICRKNGLPEIGVHGLRHSFVSLAYHLGWSELTTMQIAGYSDYNTMKSKGNCGPLISFDSAVIMGFEKCKFLIFIKGVGFKVKAG